MKILITGAAGFIGYSLSHHISNKQKKSKILGIDNIDNYYSTKLKRNRIKNIRDKNFYFSKIDICNLNKLEKIKKSSQVERTTNFSLDSHSLLDKIKKS